MPKPTVNIALIGYGFMGRAHSNALHQVKAFFNPPVEPRLRVLCGRNVDAARAVAEAFGWEETVADWREAVARPDIHVVDIATPVHTHREIALAAARAGKAIICEKPLACSLAEALEMAQAVEAAGVLNLCNYNYRRTPAVALAAQMVRAGQLGELFHWRSQFLQSWLVDPNFPLTWRLQKEKAGSGALGDLASHSIDLARYLVGEVEAVCSMLHTYTRERPLPLRDVGRASVPGSERGPVTVDDAAWALFRFRNGARGLLEVTRMATGRLTAHRFEINGREGSLAFDFERLNELLYFSRRDPLEAQGWRTIHVTQPVHPYMGAWWPAGHSIGYEHTFVHALADFFRAYVEGRPCAPDFRDAAQTQAVLEAIALSAEVGRWVEVRQVLPGG